jgi:hypothetical protein
LIDLARSDQFTEAWGIPRRTANESEDIPSALAKNTLYRTMADCELVLRFFAIRDALTEGHKGSLRRLLDRTMERHKDDTAEAMSRLASDFLGSLSKLESLFGTALFRLPSSARPSRPLYDALMVAYSLKSTTGRLRHNSTIMHKLANALEDEDGYEVLVGRGNTIEAIKQRINLASKVLFVG